MSAAGRTTASASGTSDVSGLLGESPLVGVVAHADGASIAAAGLLGRAVSAAGNAYQVSVARTRAAAARRAAAAEHPVVAVGLDGTGEGSGADASIPAAEVAALAAFDVAADLGTEPDPVLALAGLVAGGGVPGADDEGRLLGAATGVERRPGVAVPTADLADGLAHTTLAHASFSGNVGAAQAALAELDLPVELDEAAHRRVASMLALDAVGAGDAPAYAGEAIERVLRPLAVEDGGFRTVEGYADVLASVARARPGLGVGLALGRYDRATVLDAWREHASAAHAAVRAAETSRYSGLLVADAGDAPTWTVARLLRAYRSPEPVVLVLGDGEAALAGPDSHDQVARLAGVAESCDAVEAVGGTPGCGYAELADRADSDRADSDGSAADSIVEAVREVT